MTASEPISRSREDDPRFRRTRQALLEALIALVDADPQQPISITGLAEAAGVTRPTFYQHFPDISSALQQAALERMAAAFPKMQTADDGRPIDVRVAEHVLPPLVHLERHRPFYLRVVETAGSAAFFGQLVEFVKERMITDAFDPDDTLNGAPLHDVAEIVAGGSMWLVIGWLRGNHHGTPWAVAARVAAMASLVHQHKDTRPEASPS